MKRILSGIGALLLAAPLLALDARAQALGADGWVRARGRHVVVYADTGEAQAVSIAERIERFHVVGAALFPPSPGALVAPVTVLAFGEERDLSRLGPLYGGKLAEFSGLFLPSRERSIVLLNGTADGAATRVVFHEYVHRMIDLGDAPMPLWLNEGLAELYSTASVDGGRVEVGAPPPAHLALLRAEGPMPLERLVAVGPTDPEYNEARHQGTLYATSWAFAHYWTMSDPERGRDRLYDFARRLAGGEPLDEAFAAAFGRTVDEFRARFDEYLKLDELPRRVVDVAAASVARPAVDPAPPAELSCQFGFALAFQGRHSEAVPYFERARRDDPASPLPYEGLAAVARLRGDAEAAKTYYGEAIRRGSTSAQANLAFAEAALEGDGAARDREARRALERAVALNPAAPEPYALLSSIARREKDYAAALAWAERGATAAPSDGGVRLALGLAQLALRRYADARESLGRVMAEEENAAYRAAAALAAISIDRYAEAIAPSEAAHGAGSRPERADAPIAAIEELPSYFHLAPAGVVGRVRRVDCAGTALSVAVESAGRRLVFTNPKGSDVQFFTLNHNGLELFDCDVSVDREAVVAVEPSRTDRYGGVVRAVIFLNPVAAPAVKGR